MAEGFSYIKPQSVEVLVAIPFIIPGRKLVKMATNSKIKKIFRFFNLINQLNMRDLSEYQRFQYYFFNCRYPFGSGRLEKTRREWQFYFSTVFPTVTNGLLR